jgi:hypothetical protein
MWHKSRLLMGDVPNVTVDDPLKAMLKDQFLLEYGAKFKDLKNMFFNDYKNKADLSLYTFLFENSLENLKSFLTVQKTVLEIEISNNKDDIYKVGFLSGLKYINQYMMSNVQNISSRWPNHPSFQQFLNVINALKSLKFTMRDSVIDLTGLMTFSSNFKGLFDPLLLPDAVLPFKAMLDKTLEMISITKDNGDKLAVYAKSFDSQARNYKDFENQLKSWIEKWKSQGLNVPSYDDMLSAVKAEVIKDQEDKNKVQEEVKKVDMVVEQVAAPIEPLKDKEVLDSVSVAVVEPKKVNPLLIGAAGLAAAFLMLKGD